MRILFVVGSACLLLGLMVWIARDAKQSGYPQSNTSTVAHNAIDAKQYSNRDFWQAFNTIKTITDPSTRQTALIDLFNRWRQINILEAIYVLVSQLDLTDRQPVFNHAFGLMTDDDIGVMLDKMFNKFSPQNWDLWQDFFKLWFAYDHGTALLIVYQLTPIEGIKSYLDKLIVTWIREDPLEALQWARTLPTFDMQAYWTQALIYGWLKIDTDAAFVYVMRERGSNPLIPHIKTFVEMWAEFDPLTALRYALETGVELSPRQWGASFSYLAKKDIANLITMIQELDLTQFSQTDLDHLLGAPVIAVVNQDPKRAVELLNLVLNAPADLYSKVSGDLARQDLQFAKQWMETISNPEGRVNAAAAMMEVWTENEPDLAIRWLSKENENTRNGLAHHVARALSKTEPQNAGNYLIKNLPEQELTSAIIQSEMLKNWNKKDPVSAANWVLNLPESEDKPQLIHNAVRSWVRKDYTAAKAWVLDIDAPQQKDEAIFGIVYGQLTENNHAELIEWADNNLSRSSKDIRLSMLVEEWLLKQPQPAKDWILQSARLSPELKQALLEQASQSSEP